MDMEPEHSALASLLGGALTPAEFFVDGREKATQLKFCVCCSLYRTSQESTRHRMSEDELVEYMHRNGIGAFACDSHAVFSYFDLSDLREAKCKYGGNTKDGCRVVADGPHALPLLLC